MKTARQIELETLGVLAAVSLLIGIFGNIRALLFLSLALLMTGLFIPPAARIISVNWLRIAEVIGRLNTRVMLTVVWYLVLTPLALCSRLSGKDLLQLKYMNRQTMYHECRKTFSKDDFVKTW